MRNLTNRPFATVLAFLLFASTITTLTGTSLTRDALADLVPEWLLVGLALAYGAGGFLMLLGMMCDRANFEAAGCVLVFSGLLVRAVAILYVLGATPATISTVFFYVVFGWACLERFAQIVRGDHIVRIHTDVDVKFGGPDGLSD